MLVTRRRRKKHECEECKGKIVMYYSPFGLRVRHCEKCGLIYEYWANREYYFKKMLEQEDEKKDRREYK